MAGRAAGQKLEHDRQIVQSGDDFLDPNQADQHTRRSYALSGVAFIFDNADLPRLGDEKVPAGNAQVRPAELVAQVFARLHREMPGVVVIRGLEVFAEERGDALEVLMDDRGDKMARLIVVDLDDELTQVRLHHIDSGCLHGRSELDLFASHRLALDAGFCSWPRQQFESTIRPRFVAGAGEMNLATIRFDIFARAARGSSRGSPAHAA